MPHIHLLIGYICANTANLNSFFSLLLICGSFLPDFDILPAIFQKKNHRTYFTHYPLIWFFLSFLALLLKLDIFWFFLGGVLHTLSDVIDWKVYIFAPFSDFSFSLFDFNPKDILKESSPKTSLLGYYKQPQIVFTELLIILIGILIFINT